MDSEEEKLQRSDSDEEIENETSFLDANTVKVETDSKNISTESLLKELQGARKSLDQNLTQMIRSRNKRRKKNKNKGKKERRQNTKGGGGISVQ